MARPKRRILLIDPQEDRCAVTRYVLETNGHFVLSVNSLCAANLLITNGALADLLLGYSPIDEILFARMSHHPRTPAIYMAPKDNGTAHLCDATLDAYWSPMSELLDRIKIMAARKRGPLKGMKRPPKTVQPALAEACAL